MRRLKDYLHVVAWQLGLAYIALWAVAFVVLDYGAQIFEGACRPIGARFLFYWSCDPSSPLAFAADIANSTLTATVWAPVYVAAATVRPDAIALAVPILLIHLIGLPAALLVCIRMLARMVQAPRWLAKRRGAQDGAEPPPRLRTLPPASPSAFPKVKPRDTFGLRGRKS
jgi:hypothetical protein